MLKQFIFLLSIFYSFSLFSQTNYSFSKKDQIKRLYQDVSVLANDSLQGRESGTIYEIKARDYLVSQMEEIGLKPYFEGSYYSSFTLPGPVYYYHSNLLMINDSIIENDDGFYPMIYTGNGDVKGEFVKVNFNDSISDNIDLKGKIYFMDLDLTNQSDINKHIRQIIDKSIDLGALAIVFYRSNPESELPDGIDVNGTKVNIPIVFYKGNEEIFITDKFNFARVKVNVWQKNNKNAYNVAGMIDNHAEKSIVIGGHYDHLGLGYFSSRGTEGRVHNGADDNASGTAGVLELARYYMVNGKTDVNYIFVLFSAEERGLIGSKYFVSHLSDKKTIKMMLNLDMIGRLEKEMPQLELNAAGSCKQWKYNIESIEFKGNLKVIKASLPFSDHHPFYKERIPSLFLFSGTHKDYHTEKDDVEDVNFEGIVQVLDYAKQWIEKSNEYPKLRYHKVNPITVAVAYYREMLEMIKVEL